MHQKTEIENLTERPLHPYEMENEAENDEAFWDSRPSSGERERSVTPASSAGSRSWESDDEETRLELYFDALELAYNDDDEEDFYFASDYYYPKRLSTIMEEDEDIETSPAPQSPLENEAELFDESGSTYKPSSHGSKNSVSSSSSTASKIREIAAMPDVETLDWAATDTDDLKEKVQLKVEHNLVQTVYIAVSPCPSRTSPCVSMSFRGDATKTGLNYNALELVKSGDHDDITVPATLSPTGLSPAEEDRKTLLQSGAIQILVISKEDNGDDIDASQDHMGAETPSPKEMSLITTSVGTNKAAGEADLSPDTLVLVDVEDEDLTSILPPAEIHRDLILYRGYTHGEGMGENNGALEVAQFSGLTSSFYTIIEGFFGCLTEKQRMDIKRDLYDMDVKVMMTYMLTQVMSLVIGKITENLLSSINTGAFSTSRGSNSSQGCGGAKLAGLKPPSELLREKLNISEENIHRSLRGSFGRAFCDMVRADTSVRIAPRYREAIIESITEEVNSVISETIQASLKGSSSTCCQFSSCTACKEILADIIKGMKSIVTCIGGLRRDTTESPLKKKNSESGNKGDGSTGKKCIKVDQSKSHWWSCKPKVQPVTDEKKPLSNPTKSDTCSVHTFKWESPCQSETNSLSDDWTAEDVNKKKAEKKKSRIFRIFCKGKKKNNKKSSAEDHDGQTKTPSLLMRIHFFLLSCCCEC